MTDSIVPPVGPGKRPSPVKPRTRAKPRGKSKTDSNLLPEAGPKLPPTISPELKAVLAQQRDTAHEMAEARPGVAQAAEPAPAPVPAATPAPESDTTAGGFNDPLVTKELVAALGAIRTLSRGEINQRLDALAQQLVLRAQATSQSAHDRLTLMVVLQIKEDWT